MTAKLLLIDDDMAVLAALQRLFRPLLKSHSLELLCCNDPREGLALALEYQPELVICDQRMPGMQAPN